MPRISPTCIPPFDRHEALRRGRALLFLLRRALHQGLPDRASTSRSSSARSPPATRVGAAKTILDAEHPRRHVRPRLPDRDAVRGGLRAQGGRGQAGRDRPAAALRHRRRCMERGEQLFARAAPTGKRVAVVGAGPAGLACAHRLAHARPRRRRSSRRATRPAASTNTASPPTRRPTTSRRPRSTTSSSIGGITIEHGKALGRDFTLDDLQARVRRRVPRHGPRRRQRARPRRRGRSTASSTRSTTSPSCARRRTWPRCRSAAASSSSAAA